VADNGAWPQSFGEASKWAWAGVVLLGADGVVDGVLRARKRGIERRGNAAGGPNAGARGHAHAGGRVTDPVVGGGTSDDKTLPVGE
jgi:hypothetical protein